MSNNLIASALIGLSFALSGGYDANAAKMSQTDNWDLQASVGPGNITTDFLPFPQFDPSKGTLTGVSLTLISSMGGVLPVATVCIPTQIGKCNGVLAESISTGPFDFSNVNGLQQGLTTVFYTGTGRVNVPLFFQSLAAATWTARPPSGLTLTYTYTPSVGAIANPLRAALPLFASGLGALGLLGWRRKRKARVS